MPALRSALLAPSRQTARSLPFPLAPLPAETTVSFLRRLATANAVPLDAITSQVGFTPNRRLPTNADLALTRSAWDRLSVMTGRTPADLMRALRPVAPPPRAAAHPETPRVMVATPRDREITAACRHCLTERAICDELVEIWLDAAAHLCHRHHTWLRDQQLDISVTPELTRAQRRHARLAAQYAADHLAAAWAHARHITDGWRQFPFHPMAVRFRARTDLLTRHNRLDFLPQACAAYPETVHLAAIIAEPRWHAAAGGDRHDHERFLREVNHRLETDELHRTGVDDPLLAWLRATSGYRGRPITDPRRSSPLLKSTPLRISGWAQAAPAHRPRRRARMSLAHTTALQARPRRPDDTNTPQHRDH